MVTVSIIIVNYNSGEYLFNCLESLISNVLVKYEIIIVDNNSSDNSLDKCIVKFNNENIKYIQSSENLGFSKANNLGADMAKGEYLHFLNPDTIVYQDINDLYKEAQINENNVYVTRLRNPDGSIINNGYVIPTLNSYIKSALNKKAQKWFLGASILLSKRNFDSIGRWNEQFFMYSEDLDLFYRAYLNNLQTIVAKPIIYHAGGGCTSNTWTSKKRLKIINASFKKFYTINNIGWQYPFVTIIQKIYKLFHK